MLRCKFRLDSITREVQSRRLKLFASNQKDGDNKDWSQWTPSGSFEIAITNQAAFEQIDGMKPGDHFYVDIKSVEQI